MNLLKKLVGAASNVEHAVANVVHPAAKPQQAPSKAPPSTGTLLQVARPTAQPVLAVRQAIPQAPVPVAAPVAQPNLHVAVPILRGVNVQSGGNLAPQVQQDQDSAPASQATRQPVAVTIPDAQPQKYYQQTIPQVGVNAWNLSELASPGKTDTNAQALFDKMMKSLTPAQVRASLNQDTWKSRWQTPPQGPLPPMPKPGSRVRLN